MDLDRYYTPPNVASELLAAGLTGLPTPRVVADTACGAGNLLVAAQNALDEVTCIGIDSDRNAIRRLKTKKPAWLLSVADVLDNDIVFRIRAVLRAPACDLLALNPPFSMSKGKSVSATFCGHNLRSSVAMAHILRSLEIFMPVGGVVAIVPESLLFSELDREGRGLLARTHDTEVLRGLSNSTFRGARANALIVRWTPTCGTPDGAAIPETLHASRLRITRGGLPVFEATPSSEGIPLIHSTSISNLVRTGSTSHCTRVKPISRGVVNGLVLLFPRVGVPRREYAGVVNLSTSAQLSDCVFALHFACKKRAEAFRQHALRNWSALLDQYHGTGARYISVARMADWAQRVATAAGL